TPDGDSQIRPAVASGHVHHHQPGAVVAAPEEGSHAAPMHDAMAHEMGHGAGMDMGAMARDMRNRFFISLIFSLPIFGLSPMGMDRPLLTPPFGLDLNFTLFLLASAAILYPVWPFVVAAIRALRNGILNMAVLVLLSVGTGYLFSVDRHGVAVQRPGGGAEGRFLMRRATWGTSGQPEHQDGNRPRQATISMTIWPREDGSIETRNGCNGSSV
ncbi:MAG: hypothetical protein AB7L36_15200, partial [Sphingomonadaceae bacterium]